MSEPRSSNPLRAVMTVRRSELPLALLMFGYFFLTITTFWILKPIKKTVFINFYKQGAFDFAGLSLSVLFVDYARYEGAPALIVGFTAANGGWTWAVGPECGTPGAGAATLAKVPVR